MPVDMHLCTTYSSDEVCLKGHFSMSRSNKQGMLMGHIETDPSAFWYFVTPEVVPIREYGFQHNGNDLSLALASRYPRNTKLHISPSLISFVRGDPTLTFFVFLVDEGREDPNTTKTVHWQLADDDPTLNAGLVAL